APIASFTSQCAINVLDAGPTACIVIKLGRQPISLPIETLREQAATAYAHVAARFLVRTWRRRATLAALERPVHISYIPHALFDVAKRRAMCRSLPRTAIGTQGLGVGVIGD